MGTIVQGSGIIVRDEIRRHPVAPQSWLSLLGYWFDGFCLSGFHVLPAEFSKLVFVVYCDGICGIQFGKITVSSAPPVQVDVLPWVLHSIFGQSILKVVCARPKKSGIVLGAAVDVIGFGHIHRDSVKFPNWEIVEMEPGWAAVIGAVKASVVTQQQAVRFIGIDPHLVHVQMHDSNIIWQQMNNSFSGRLKSFTAILGANELIP